MSRAQKRQAIRFQAKSHKRSMRDEKQVLETEERQFMARPCGLCGKAMNTHIGSDLDCPAPMVYWGAITRAREQTAAVA